MNKKNTKRETDNKLNTCIICMKKLQRDDFDKEHVFPEAIGGTFTIQSVCRSCNAQLGNTVDAALVNHSLVAAYRLALGISGKTKVPNPFERGTLVDAPQINTIFLVDGEGRPKDLRVVPNVLREKLGKGAERVTLVVDVSEKDNIPEIVNKIRTRRGLRQLSDKEIENTIKRQLSKHSDVKIELAIDLLKYKRGVIKIGYELACTWLGETYFEDPCAQLLRECLIDDDWESKVISDYNFKGMIKIIDAFPSIPFWNATPYEHIAFITKQGHEVVCYVRIFQVVEGYVMVSKQAEKYRNISSRFLAIDPISGSTRESTVEEEFARLSRTSR